MRVIVQRALGALFEAEDTTISSGASARTWRCTPLSGETTGKVFRGSVMIHPFFGVIAVINMYDRYV